MTFPASISILDDFQRADGALGANWIDGSFGDSTGLLIAGHAVTAVTNAQFSGSVWKTHTAQATAIFAQVTVLPPAPPEIVQLCFLSDFNGTNNLKVRLFSNLDFAIVAGGTNTINIAGQFSAGDWIAMTYDPGSNTLFGWTAHTPAGPWNQRLSSVSSVSPNGTPGWYLQPETNSTTARMTNFGGETLPLAGASAITPLIHGRGAC